MKKGKPTLKEQAQEVISKNPAAIEKIPPMDIKQLIEDLQVHQIELEMQNEELRRVQQDLEKARDKYSDLYDFSPACYFTINEKGIITRGKSNRSDHGRCGKEITDRPPIL